MRVPVRRAAALALFLALAAASGRAAARPGGDDLGGVLIEAPPFTIRAPAPLGHQATRIAELAPRLALRIAGELALPPPAAGTIVVLAGRDTAGPFGHLAAGMPEWAAGITVPATSLIVLRLDRIGTWGQREISAVLAHELTHLVVALALPDRGAGIPAWCREGLASSISREAEMRDRWFLWTSSLGASARPFAALEAALASGEPSRAVAYAGSLDAVGFLRREYGEAFPARLLGALSRGLSFERAFIEATGVTVDHAERLWRDDLRRPRRWIVVIGSIFSLWVAATLLFLVAYAVKRRRARRTMEIWRDEEEPPLPERDPGGPPVPLAPGGDDRTVH